MMTVKAAGLTLAVGELREALAGMDDNAAVTAHDRPVMIAVSSVADLELDPDVELDVDALAEFRDLLERIANGGAGATRLADVRKEAARLLADYPE